MEKKILVCPLGCDMQSHDEPLWLTITRILFYPASLAVAQVGLSWPLFGDVLITEFR